VSYTAGRSEEYCNTETFQPHCSNGEVIVIEDAIYGRHHIGKCIDADEANTFKDPRYFGCSINVRQFINTKCAARKTCEVRIADAELEKNSPCLKGLKMFLEASFTCVAGERRFRYHVIGFKVVEGVCDICNAVRD
jgi:Galactose binding lectin domain